MKITLIFTLFFLSLQAYATDISFDFQTEIDKANKKFKNILDEYPILVFDRDELKWQFLKNKAFGEEGRQTRIDIIKNYVLKEIGIELTDIEADNYDTYISTLDTSAVALPTIRGGDYAMCAVFPPSPNSNQSLEIERLLGLNTKDVYGNLGHQNIVPRPGYKELSLLSLYHEVSHCLDNTFLPSTYRGHENSHTVHLSESFAELLGIFFLRKMGITGYEKDRALIRTIYSVKMGKYFAQNPNLGFGNPHFVNGGAIYHLAPIIFAGLEYVTWERREFNDLSISGLINKARELVEYNAYSSRAFFAISSYLKSTDEGIDVLIDYRDRAFESPEFFAEAYGEVVKYDDFTKAALKRSIDPNREGETTFNDLSPLSIGNLCPLIKDGDREEFFTALKDLRIELINSNASQDQKRKRANQLNNIFSDLQASCQ